MKIAIYSRKSKLSEKSESIQNQIQMCKEYADSHLDNCEFLIYQDEGFSGGNTDRPAFNSMLIDAKKSKFEKLICYRLDRVSRSVIDFSSTLELLNERDIDFISISEHFDTSTPMGRAMMYIASVFAQLERETIAERIRDNMLKLARTGRWLGGPAPIGYKLASDLHTTDNGIVKKVTKLSIDEKAIEQVRYIFHRFLEVRAITALVKVLRQEGIKTKKGTHYCQRTLIQMLQNPVYVQSDKRVYEYFKRLGTDVASTAEDFNGNGVLISNKHIHKSNKHRIRSITEWIITVGNHPGIIEPNKWLEVQTIMEANTKQYTRGRVGTSQVGLLGSLLVCGHCGSKLRITYRAKDKDGSINHYYYKCRLKEEDPSQCNIKNLNGKEADQRVVQSLLETANQDNRHLMQTLASSKADLPRDVKDSLKQKELLKHQIEYLNKKIEGLTERLSDSEIDVAVKGYIIKQIKKYDAEIQNITQQLSNIEYDRAERYSKKANEELLNKNLIFFRNNGDAFDFQTKKAYLKEMLKEVIWDGEKLDIRLNI